MPVLGEQAYDGIDSELIRIAPSGIPGNNNCGMVRGRAVTPMVAKRTGRIAAMRPRGLADCLIAATALEHHLTLVTRNVADFDDLAGLELVNPCDG